MNETEAKATAANFKKAIGALNVMNAKKALARKPGAAGAKWASLDDRKDVRK